MSRRQVALGRNPLKLNVLDQPMHQVQEVLSILLYPSWTRRGLKINPQME